MTESVELLNMILGTGGVLLLPAAALLYFDLFVHKGAHFGSLIGRYGLLLAATLTTGAAIMALVYSEVFGFVPCGLCWSMRIFMFSQAFIMVTALLRSDTGIAIYGIVLSVPGIIIGLYQHYLQMGGAELIGCPVATGGDCSKQILLEYGFMTFPLMGASMLIFLVAVYIYLYRIRTST